MHSTAFFCGPDRLLSLYPSLDSNGVLALDLRRAGRLVSWDLPTPPPSWRTAVYPAVDGLVAVSHDPLSPGVLLWREKHNLTKGTGSLYVTAIGRTDAPEVVATLRVRGSPFEAVRFQVVSPLDATPFVVCTQSSAAGPVKVRIREFRAERETPTAHKFKLWRTFYTGGRVDALPAPDRVSVELRCVRSGATPSCEILHFSPTFSEDHLLHRATVPELSSDVGLLPYGPNLCGVRSHGCGVNEIYDLGVFDDVRMSPLLLRTGFFDPLRHVAAPVLADALAVADDHVVHYFVRSRQGRLEKAAELGFPDRVDAVAFSFKFDPPRGCLLVAHDKTVEFLDMRRIHQDAPDSTTDVPTEELSVGRRLTY